MINPNDPTMPGSLKAKIEAAAKNPVRYDEGADLSTVPADVLRKAAGGAATSAPAAPAPASKKVLVHCGTVKLKLTLTPTLLVKPLQVRSGAQPRPRRPCRRCLNCVTLKPSATLGRTRSSSRT